MAAELRWILLLLCVPLLAAIWWWSARRSGHAPGDSALRESTVPKPSDSADAADEHAAKSDPDAGDASRLADRTAVPDRPAGADRPAKPEPARGMRISPLEPLDVHDADYQPMRAHFDHVPVLDTPMMIHPEPSSAVAFAPATPVIETPAPPPTLTPEPAATPPAKGASSAERQRIVTVRVCAPGEGRWSGAQLLNALELHGLAYGKYGIFHRKHTDGQSLYCVASLIEPGTFDLSTMAAEEFRGVTIFAVLPGPLEATATLDDLLATARGLAEEMSGMVQDAKGVLFSPQRMAALREDVARFQAALPGG